MALSEFIHTHLLYTENMQHLSRKIHILLGVTSIVFSRLLFFLVDDSEGPNLLIVTALAVVLFCTFEIILHYYLHRQK